jgi:hypothetical protein
VVRSVDGQAVTDLVGVGRLLNRKRAGETVRIEVLAVRRRGMMLQLSEGRAEVRLQ